MIYKLAKTRYRRTLDQEDIVYIADERKHIINIYSTSLSFFTNQSALLTVLEEK